eukprot:m.66033 g.66033  ORF g.66033 m.66033 type:complete len:206 (-) comp14028_c0_seq2:206-823(-)
MQRVDSSGMQCVEAKIVLLGMQGVGKTSLVQRYTQGVFSDVVTSTIGASFFTHKMIVDGCHIKCQIWDTAGQERFRSMAPMYYRGAHAAMLVYDVNDQNSFENVHRWVKELQRNVTGTVLLCLIGNKIDLPSDRAVTSEKGREFAESINALFYETSAKTDVGIQEAFLKLAKELIKLKAPSRERGINVSDAPPASAAATEPGKCC